MLRSPVLLLRHAGICRRVFSVLSCTRLTHCHSVLMEDSSVICGQSPHGWYKALAYVVFVVVCLGVPVFLAVQLRPKASTKEERHTFCMKQIQASYGTPSEQVPRGAWDDLVHNERFTFLTSGYRAGYQHWECVDWFRKLTFAFTLTRFPAGTPIQAVCTGALSVMWCCVQTHFMPYRFAEGECSCNEINVQ